MADINEKTLASLAKHRLFKGIDRAAVEKMASHAAARRRQLAKGEVALHKGDRLRNLVLVLSGRVNIVQQLRDGTELLDYTVKAGGVVGVTFLMPRADSFPSMIQAAEPSEVVLLDAGKVRELMKMPENSRLRENVYQAVVTVLCECHRKLSVVGCWEIGDKVLTYIEYLAAEEGSREVEIPFRTSSEFAQFLGVNRCALSRSVSQLVRSGKLKRVDGRYVLPAAH
jgi:CRP-like cAMP-binding protein